MTTPHKLYPHITGLRGDEGENTATLAIVAVLDPSPHYPDSGRIIVGSPETSDAEIGGFSGGPAAMRQIARTLDQAAADVELATGAAPPATEPIPVLWFAAEGYGPDPVALELHPFAAERDGAIPASLGLRVRSAGELVVFAGPLINGGFNLDRASAAEFHRQLGAWLEASRG